MEQQRNEEPEIQIRNKNDLIIFETICKLTKHISTQLAERVITLVFRIRKTRNTKGKKE